MRGDEWTVIRPGSAWYWGQDGKLHEAGANEPVFEFEPGTGKSLGLRVEGQNTYPLLWSEDFSNPYWSTSWNESIATVSPVADDRFGVKYLLSVNSLTTTAGVRSPNALVQYGDIPATLNCIFERHEDFSGLIWFGNFYGGHSGLVRLTFDVGGEVISNVIDNPGLLIDYGWKKLGNGVYHLWLSFLNRVGSHSRLVLSKFDSAYVGNLCYLIKAWINFGTNPVSYCKTEGSIVTRPADIITRSIDHYNPEQGTWVISVDALNSVVAEGIGFDTARFDGQGVVVYAYDNNGGRLYLNGQQALATPKPGTPLALQFSATVRQFTKYLRYYTVALPDEKCKELATGAVTIDWLFDGDEILHLDYLGQDYGYRSADDALIVARDNSLVDIPVTSFTRAGSGWVMGPDGTYSEAGIDVPRFQYAPTTGEAEGLLLEPQSTNYVRPTQGFSPTAGGTVYGLVWGMSSATSLVWDGEVAQVIGNGGGVRVYFGYNATPFDNASALWSSVEVKAGTYEYVRLSTTIAANASNAVRLNLATGEVTLRGTPLYKVIPLNDGWYRIGISRSYSNFYLSCLALYLTSYIGGSDYGWYESGLFPAEGQYIYMRRPQVELVPSMTSFIPTSVSAVTRPADVYVSDLDELPSYSGDVGTIVITLKEPQFLAYPFLLAASTTDPTDGDHIRVDRESDGTLYLVAQDSEGADATTPDSADKPTVDTVYKLGIRWSGSDIAMCVNGGGVRKLTNVSPAGLRYLILGNGQHALLHKATYTRRAVSDSELQNMTGE